MKKANNTREDRGAKRLRFAPRSRAAKGCARAVLVAFLFALVLSGCAGQQASVQEEEGTDPAQEEEAPAPEETTAPPPPEEPAVTVEAEAPRRDAPQPSANTAEAPAVGANGMVSSAHPLATQVGLDVLEEGGNAYDAAVAVGAALGVVEPYMSGIGGYGAVVAYDAEEGEARFLDAPTRMPAALDPAAFRPPTPGYLENRRGTKAVSTPNAVEAWETLSRDHGELEWRRLFEPAVELAEGGFYIGDVAAGWISSEYAAFPGHARAIYGSGTSPLRTGDLLVQEDLGRSLRLVGEEGAGAVNGGTLGQAIDVKMRETGGFLALDDLRGNRASWRDTTSIEHRGHEVATSSPPSTAWGTLVRLGTMAQFGLEPQDHNSAAYLHAFAEVTKREYEARQRYAADPELRETPLDLLLSEGYWADEAANVDPSRATPYSRSSGEPSSTYLRSPANRDFAGRGVSEEQEHTTHFVVADGEGNVVSATQTLGNIFGSRVMPEGTGIWLNDSIAYSDFEPPGNPSDAFPGRQRLVGISPILVMRDGKPVAALGTPGGRTILQTTPQMLMNMLDFGMDIQRAIAAPRISFVEPDVLAVDAGLPQPVRDELSALGHNVATATTPLGNAHGLTVEYDGEGRPARFTGGADLRGEGVAAGY